MLLHISYSAFFLLSMKSHIFPSFFSNLFAGERQHLLSGTRGATHEVSLMHEEHWVRLLWIFSMLTKLQQHVWQSTELCAWALPKVVETPLNLASGKAPLWQINIIISLVWMMKVRPRGSDKASCRQPCGRVRPGFSHGVSTAEDRVIMEFPSSHPQNKELLFFSDPMGLHGSQYHVFRVPIPALLLCYPLKHRSFELLTPKKSGTWRAAEKLT